MNDDQSWVLASAMCPFFATSVLAMPAPATETLYSTSEPLLSRFSPLALVHLAKESGAAVDILCGSVAGMTSKLIEHPFDTIKVRLQSQHIGKSKKLAYTGSWDCLRQALHDRHGLCNLYRGLASPLVGAVGENAILFFTYGMAQSVLSRTVETETGRLPISHLTAAGAFAGGCVSFLLTPVELIKCRMQVLDNSASVSSLQLLRNIIRQHGWRGMYCGYSGTLLREVFGGAAWFGTYEVISRRLMETSGEKEMTTKSALMAGAAAGIAYNTILFPADVIKSQQQTRSTPTSFTNVAKQLWRAEGYRGFYRGFGITFARAGPSSAMIFYTYEMLRRTIAE